MAQVNSEQKEETHTNKVKSRDSTLREHSRRPHSPQSERGPWPPLKRGQGGIWERTSGGSGGPQELLRFLLVLGCGSLSMRNGMCIACKASCMCALLQYRITKKKESLL